MRNRKNSAKRGASDSDLTRESWKVFQIMAEFVEGFERLANIKPSVSMFGSSRLPPESPFYALGEQIARLVSDAGFSVVTGGGPGLMEAFNKGAYAGRSASIGLNIQLPREQIANNYQDEALYFKHFFSRKVMFVKYASAYIVLPGGFGTLDEFAEILTLIQTGKSRRIPIILVHRPFWDGLVKWFRGAMLESRTISPEDLDLFVIVDTPQQVVDAIFRYYEQRGLRPGAPDKGPVLDL